MRHLMKKLGGLALLTMLLTLTLYVQAQTKPTPVTPSSVMPAGKFPVNIDTIKRHVYGFGGQRFSVSCNTDAGDVLADCIEQSRAPAGDGGFIANGGAFRVSCPISHMSFDDPIVWPKQSGKTHLHAFFGNTLTGAQYDASKMGEFGRSTCAGGTINRTGYWIPPLVIECGRPDLDGPCPLDENGKSREGEVQIPSSMNVYYKCCYENGAEHQTWPLKGHRMIIGSATNTLPNFGGKIDGGRIECIGFPVGGVASISYFDHIPSEAEGAAVASGGNCHELNFFIPMDLCWDGINLDTPDHQSHMAHLPEASKGGYHANPCSDPAYPVLLASPILNVHTVLKHASDLNKLRLASDPPKRKPDGTLNPPAGYTLHSDWANGWDQTTNVAALFGQTGFVSWTDQVQYGCHNKGILGTPGGSDWVQQNCHDFLLGKVKGTNKYLTLY